MKQAKISVLKARLSAYLAQVRRGEAIEVLDRSTPVARLVPVEFMADGFRVEEPVDKPGDLFNLPVVKTRKKRDTVRLLKEDRDQR